MKRVHQMKRRLFSEWAGCIVVAAAEVAGSSSSNILTITPSNNKQEAKEEEIVKVVQQKSSSEKIPETCSSNRSTLLPRITPLTSCCCQDHCHQQIEREENKENIEKRAKS